MEKREIAKKIRRARERLNLSQEQFAARLGTTWVTVSRWERGVSVPSREMLVKLKEYVQG